MSLPLFCRQAAGKNRKRNTTVPKTKSAYPEEFKREALAYQASTGQAEVAAHFGISPVAAVETPEAEWRRLRREHRELQMRCKILKTVGIFSSPSANATGGFKA
jgi:hypothetical protein